MKFAAFATYIKENNIIKNVILFCSIISINFAAYFSFFDINALLIIDSTTISKHILGIIVLYVIVSAVVAIIFLIFQNILLLEDRNNILPRKTISLNIFGSIRNQLERLPESWLLFLRIIFDNAYIQYALSVIIFCFFYVGTKTTFIIVAIFAISFTIILVIRHRHDKKESIVEANNETLSRHRSQSHNKQQDFSPSSIFPSLESLKLFSFISDASDLIAKGEHMKFLVTKVGIMLVFLSISLGIGRALFVQNNIFVNINSSDKEYVLFITTADGIGLFDKEMKQVSFSSWGNINELVFLSKKRRSYQYLVE